MLHRNIFTAFAFLISNAALLETNAFSLHLCPARLKPLTIRHASKPKGFSPEIEASTSSSLSSNDNGRKQSINALEEWAKSVGIQRQQIKVASGNSILGGGLGLLTTNDVSPNSILLQIPNHLAFTVSNSPLDINPTIESYFADNPKAYRNAPWWAKLSLDLYNCDQISSLRSTTKNPHDDQSQVDMRPWLDSLPRIFESPFHWTHDQRNDLQYPPLQIMISAQEKSYRSTFDALSQAISSSSSSSPSSPLLDNNWSYQDFVWGCECARSRAFSGAYGGSAFNPAPYALTLLLVAFYIGFHLGTIEQAANGAALVFCGSVFRDFVLPKLFKSKRYVICPYIDMANHVGVRGEGNVAFEYFANAYSLVTKLDGKIPNGQEVRISYGSRSNDALLQNYGFVENDNAHDVYVMPSLGEWDISALEKACGRTFRPGRLGKLERVGLLGSDIVPDDDEEDGFDESAGNRSGGVVITRSGGIDPAILTALRVLVSTDEEWDASGEAVGNFVTDNSGGVDNEKAVRVVAQKALELELESKETTLEEDEALLKKGLSGTKQIAVCFRIEKKKLLRETIQNLKYAM